MRTVSEFFEMCLRPSGIMLCTAAIVVLAFQAALLQLSPQSLHGILSVYPGYGDLDDRYDLFQRLMAIEDARPDRLELAIIGASTTREAFWDTASLSSRISARLNRPAYAVNLASSGQPLVVSRALTEITACKGYDYIVLGVNMSRFNAVSDINPEDVVGVPAPGHGDRLENFGYSHFTLRTLYMLAHYLYRDATGESRLVKKRARKAKTLSAHRYLSKSPKTDAETVQKLARVTKNYAREYKKNADRAFEDLDSIAQLAAACGAKLILIDTPVHPWLMQKAEYKPYQDTRRAHLEKIEAFAAAHNLIFVDVNKLVAYSPEDLFDQGHLRTESSIRATTNAIADAIAESAEKALAAKRGMTP